jgi:hypothetical protein
MRHSSKKRFLLVGAAVTTVGAAAALIAGATFGFFSSAGTATGNNTFTAGKVVVGLDPGGTQVTCAIGPMSPGDTQAKSGNVACKYDIKYTGNVNAFMAMDLSITGAGGTPQIAHTQTTAPAAAQGLYDGSATGLQFTITDDDAASYMSGVSYTNQAHASATLTPTGGSASIANLLVTAVPITTNETKSVTVNYTLPTTADNAYNLATSTLVLRIHAVQADNNALPVGCTTAGHVCTTSMNWS